LRQVLAALDTVPTAGVVHRDVKPANLLLIATGHGRPHVLLSDFGIAIDLRGPRFTETGAFVGTPGYLAPELAAGAEPHPTADLYAAGQVALFMLTGHRPSGPDTAARPAGVPDTLWDLIGRLTSAHPSDRPQSAIETAAALRAADLAWIDQPNYEIDIFSHLTDDPAGRSQLVATASGAVLVEPGGSTSGAARLRQEPRGDADPRSARANLDHAVPAQTLDSSPTPEPIIHEAAAPSGWADRGVRSRAVLAALVAAVLAGLVLLWSPWRISRTDGASTPPETRSSVTAAASPIGASSPATETNAPSPMASVTPDTQGSVRVGTVVATVGQPCEFSNVGVRETTLDGAPVVCQRRADGSYVWDPPPS
jgi:serine/threonine protein kinase